MRKRKPKGRKPKGRKRKSRKTALYPGETDCKACSGTGVSSRGHKCYPCGGSGIELPF